MKTTPQEVDRRLHSTARFAVGVFGQPVDISSFMTDATNEGFPVAVTNAWPSDGFEAQLTNASRMGCAAEVPFR